MRIWLPTIKCFVAQLSNFYLTLLSKSIILYLDKLHVRLDPDSRIMLLTLAIFILGIKQYYKKIKSPGIIVN